MRSRRSSRSASGVSIVNGRIAGSPVSVVTHISSSVVLVRRFWWSLVLAVLDGRGLPRLGNISSGRSRFHKWYWLTIAHRDGLIPRQHANWDLQAAGGGAGRAAEVMNDQNAERDPSPL